jgi:hypothetical protein
LKNCPKSFWQKCLFNKTDYLLDEGRHVTVVANQLRDPLFGLPYVASLEDMVAEAEPGGLGGVDGAARQQQLERAVATD